VRLSALIPPAARSELKAALSAQGAAFDINQLRPDRLEDLIGHPDEAGLDLDTQEAKGRVRCE
jgi:hypothetical protein